MTLSRALSGKYSPRADWEHALMQSTLRQLAYIVDFLEQSTKSMITQKIQFKITEKF